MKIYKSAIYDQFRCIAAECPDSCCHEWSISIDPDTAAMYRSLTGDLGERLRQIIADDDGIAVMVNEDGRCPMWRDDGLCRIQAELGHDALCKTCRDFPRLTHDYGDFQEWGLELSCPEAARLLLTSPAASFSVTDVPGTAEAEYDPEDMRILLQTRQTALALLEQDRPIPQRLALLLMYGYHAQESLDSMEVSGFDPDAALAAAQDFAGNGNTDLILDFFKNLEILTDRWKKRLNAPLPGKWIDEFAALARYFIERYWLQAISDFDLVGRVKLAVISCLTIRILGGDLIQTAQLYSKEIENDPNNVEAILDGAYSAHAFTDDKLLGLLLL